MRTTGVLIMIIILSGCVDPFNTDTKKTVDNIVVEGKITNQAPPYFITITSATNYTQNFDGITRYISGVQVKVCDDQGNCIPFFEVLRGRYQTAVNAVRGEVGKSYHVEIKLADNQVILSTPEKMLASPPINRVYSEFDPSTLKTEGFRVYLDVADPAAERNYYKWETIGYEPYSTYCFTRTEHQPVQLISSDERVNGNMISRVHIQNVPFISTTYYDLETYQLAITPEAYQYLTNIKKQVQSTGSIFDPPPTFIRGNLYYAKPTEEEVLGYFIVAGVTRMDLLIDRTTTTTGLFPGNFVNLVPEPQYCGDPCNYLCVAFAHGKCGLRPCPPDCASLPGKTNIAPDAWPLPHHPCE